MMMDPGLYEKQAALIQMRWPAVWSELKSWSSPVDPVWRRGSRADAWYVDEFRLASHVDPGHEAHLRIASIPASSPEAWVYGIGSGQMIRLLRQRPALKMLHVVILHPALFRSSLGVLDHSTWLSDPKVNLHWPHFGTAIRGPLVVSPVCMRLAPPGPPQTLREQLQLELGTTFIREKHAALPLLNERITESLKYLERDALVSALFGHSKGHVFAVAGAGPSLADAYGWLRERRPELTLVAVDGALKSLAMVGLTPDVVVTMDASPHVRGLFDGLPEAFSQVPLVYFPSVDPLVLEEWTGPRYLALTDSPLYRRWETHVSPVNRLFSAGSVIHPAVDLALHMGAESVLLCGTDFSFPKDISHAWGFPFRIQTREAIYPITAESGRGEPLPSIPALNGYRLDLEQYIARHPHIRFYSASPRGARISGAPVHPDLADALLEDHRIPPFGPAADPVAAVTDGQHHLAALRLFEAERAFRGALAVLTQPEHTNNLPGLLTQTRLGLAEICLLQNRLSDAEALLRTIDLSDAAADPVGTAGTHRLQGWLAMQQGRLDDAQTAVSKGLSLAMTRGLTLEEALLHQKLAELRLKRTPGQFSGPVAQSIAHAQAIWEEQGDPLLLGRFFLAFGETCMAAGKYDSAADNLHWAVESFSEAGKRGRMGVIRALHVLFLLQRDHTVDDAGERDCVALTQQGALAFRMGFREQGHGVLVDAIDCITGQMSLGRLNIDPQHFNPLFHAILAAQQREDPIALADLLEYELAPALNNATETQPVSDEE